MVPETELPPVTASVVYLRLNDGDGPAAGEPSARHEQLTPLLRDMAACWPADARIVLDTPDGAAIAGFGAPGAALAAAQAAARLAGGVPGLGIALHHGPVRLQRGQGTGARLQGECIVSAGHIAARSTPRTPLLSGAFRDALVAASPGHAAALRAAGEFSEPGQPAQPLHTFDAPAWRARQRRRHLVGAGAVAAILAVGGVARVVLDQMEAARRPAVIVLEIKPFGEVFVDGESKGTSPPLSRLWVAPGAHTIEVRNGRFRPLKMDLQLKPGEELELKHVFSSTPVRKPGLLERLKFW